MPRMFGIAASVAAVGVIAAGAWSVARALRTRDTAPVSIAVAPIRNQADASDASFADGLTQEITSGLTRYAQLAPRPYASVLGAAAGETDPVALGKKLDVEYVFFSTLRRSGKLIRLSGELIRVKDGTTAWSPGTYEGYEADLFAMQDSIKTRIVNQLAGRLLPPTAGTAAGLRSTRDPEAYKLFLQARSVRNLLSVEGVREAIGLYAKSIERDSAFSEAWSGLGNTLGLSVQFSGEAQADLLHRASDAINHAIVLDSSNGDAWFGKAQLTRGVEWNWEAASQQFERAIRLSPSSAWAYDLYAQHLFDVFPAKRDSAARLLDRAIALDPTNSHFAMIRGYHLLSTGHPREADSALTRALELNPDNWVAYMMRSWMAYDRGEFAAAIRHSERAQQMQGWENQFATGQLAHMYGIAGQSGKAQMVLDTLTAMSRRRYVQRGWLAVAHLAVGNRARALDELEASANAHEWDILVMLSFVRPALSTERRYQDVVRGMKLDGSWATPRRY